ncbi:hypothetical protein MNBD_CHLOROFLEXI01-908 [hydrothermal vent metagenome]|uniref:Lipoprotein n=1 Tax=hydrothermal vent metagenome TaxID=652676 RepID=A0A3B0W1H9_9ZZZZ
MQKKFIYRVITLLILLTLTACSQRTQAEPAASNSNTGEAESGVLQPVTPVTEKSDPVVDADVPEAETKEEVVDSTEASRMESEGTVLIYERRGGLKGIGTDVQEWRFYEDGRIVGSDGTSWQVEPETIQTLIAELTTSGFETLETSYIPEDTCCDRVTHTIIVQTGGQTQTVETLDGADMPRSLEDNLQQINDFLMGLYE